MSTFLLKQGKKYLEKSRVVWKNWANIKQCTPHTTHYPTCVEEVVDVVMKVGEEGGVVKVVGSGHSPSDIACTDSHLMNLSQLSNILHVDISRKLVKIQSGVKLSKLNAVLPSHGLALTNLGSISDQTIAGALSTGTHGTGVNYGIFGTAVLELEVVSGWGEVVKCSRVENEDVFFAAICGLGCIGIIVTVTLQCEDAFWLHSTSEPMTFKHVINDWEALSRSAEHVRFTWYPHTQFVEVWRASRYKQQKHSRQSTTPTSVPPLPWWLRSYFLTHIVLEFLYFLSLFVPIIGRLVSLAYGWMSSVAGVKEVRDRSDRVFNFDCLFKQHVIEWAIPIQSTPQVLQEIQEFLLVSGLVAHFPLEVRFAAADDLWLSPCFGRSCCYIGSVMYRPYGKDVQKETREEYVRGIETIMRRVAGRPHWAKEFHLKESDFSTMYPKWRQFQAVRQRMDPKNIFVNDWVKRVVMKNKAAL